MNDALRSVLVMSEGVKLILVVEAQMVLTVSEIPFCKMTVETSAFDRLRAQARATLAANPEITVRKCTV